MVVYNPATGEYEIDPTSFAMSSGDSYFDPVLGDIDPLNEHKGVGGGAGDNSYSSVGVDPSTLWDPTKGIDWNKLKSFITSPAGIAGLGGAALGYLDRPKPTGGGTTMAYPGAAQLTRKMVQGPYGPLAEYTGVGGGAPDYTRFTAPKVEFPTAAPSPAPSPGGGLSVQAKVDLYKQLRGYGLSDERVRRIAETMFGLQTDSDWAELGRLAGMTGGIAAPAAPKPSPTPAPAPSQGPSTYKPTAMASWLQTSLSPIEKAAAYNAYLSNNMTDAEIRSMADKTFGKQSDSDWAELKRIADTLPKNLLPSGRSFTDLELKGAVQKFLDSSQQPKSAPREEPSTFTGPPSLQVSQSSTPQQKAQEYQRLRQFGMSDSQIRAMVDAQMGKQTDSDWQYLKNLAGETAATVAPQNLSDPSSANWYVGKDYKTPVLRSGRLGVSLDLRGQPEYINYYNEAGEKLSSSTFSAPDLLRNAQKYGININDALGLGQGLEFNKIGYRPGDLYRGFGSDLGIDFEDLAAGGYGTAYDWTKDPLVAMKGPGALESLRANQELAQSLGLKRSDLTTSGGILPEKLAPLTSIKTGYRPYVVDRGGSAGFYATLAEAQKNAAQFGGTVRDLSALPVINTDNPNARTGDIRGFLPPAQVASAAPATAQPAAPRDLKSLLPSDWGSITDPSKKIDWFNQQKATQAELTAAGVTPEEIAWMRQNKLGTFAQGGITQGYAHGGEARAYAGGRPLTMEDGGFVFTKKATDRLGDRGIAALGGKKISAPGNGTDDRGITGIIGKHGVTPARVSNGESYFPPGHDTKKLYALMNQLQRKA